MKNATAKAVEGVFKSITPPLDAGSLSLNLIHIYEGKQINATKRGTKDPAHPKGSSLGGSVN